jgi:hypothetical protein
MNDILKKLEATPLSTLQWAIVALSIMIATQVQYIQHGWINPDSVLYLEAAKLFANGEWQAGFNVFAWPLYALCIAAVHQFSPLNIHTSAQLLNVIFFAIATFGFLKIIQLGGGKQRQLIAGALIWLSAQYMIGGALEMLMRDEGFWALYLMSLVFFIQFYKSHQLKDALLWQVCILIAMLFRIEAILFLALLPLVLLFNKQWQFNERLIQFFKCNMLHIALVTIVLVLFTTNSQLSSNMLGRLNEVFTFNIYQEFTKNLVEKSHMMSTQILGEHLDKFAVQGLLLTFIYVMCVKAIATTGIINIGLAGLAAKHHKRLIDPETYRVLCATVIIALFSMSLIITKVFVLSSRYVLALSFILMIFATFYLADLLKYLNHSSKQKKWLVIGLIIISLLGAIKNLLPKRDGYNYQQEAVAWLSSYNKLNHPVFYDDPRMRYYADLPFVGKETSQQSLTLLRQQTQDNTIQKYHFLVVTHSNKQGEYAKWIERHLQNYKSIQQFSDASGKKSILVYEKQ